MERRQLGESHLQVSPVAFGGWPIAGMTSLDVNDRDSRKTIVEAVDCGINFIDTAHCYGINGESEKLIGQAIQPFRDDLVLASKAGIHWDSHGVRHFDGRPETIIAQCDESLRRMRVESIDLFYLHAPDPKVPVQDSASAFVKLIEAGKIHAAGASNLDVSQLDQFHPVCPITAVQPPYNMIQRGIERDIIPWCQEHTVSVVNYWPLMKGLLAGKIRRGHRFDPNDKRLTYDVFQGEKFESAQRLIDELEQIALPIEKTIAQLVVNWTFHQPGITATLCGAKRDWQIRESASAMGWSLDASAQARIEKLLAPFRDS